MGWAQSYLEMLRQDPTLSIRQAAERLDIDYSSLMVRRRSRSDVLEEERKIKDVWTAEQRLKDLDAVERAVAEKQEAEEIRDLPFVLERFLQLYRLHDDRVKVVRLLQEEGFDIEVADIVEAREKDKGFRRAYDALWQEGTIEAEDQFRRKARTGGRETYKYLQAHMPQVYGNKVKVDVAVQHQLDPGDRALIDGVKQQFIAPLRPAKAIPAQSEDVVDGEAL